jgi:hypothetical protein
MSRSCATRWSPRVGHPICGRGTNTIMDLGHHRPPDDAGRLTSSAMRSA